MQGWGGVINVNEATELFDYLTIIPILIQHKV